MVKCPYCGTKARGTDAHCRGCGAEIQSGASPTAVLYGGVAGAVVMAGMAFVLEWTIGGTGMTDPEILAFLAIGGFAVGALCAFRKTGSKTRFVKRGRSVRK